MHCFITIRDEVIGKMPRHWPGYPDWVAAMIYDAITAIDISLPIDRKAFSDIVGPGLMSVFCNWERGKPKDAWVMTDAVFSALERASIVPVIAPPTRLPSTLGRAAD